MTFRSKTPARALEAELRTLRERHGVSRVMFVDDILDMRYFRTLLPRLAVQEPRFELFWEVKANLTPEQVRLLRAAGVTRVQPGIESLSRPRPHAHAQGDDGTAEHRAPEVVPGVRGHAAVEPALRVPG